MAWARTAPRPLVFTNGVFELLHVGHVALLERAAGFGRSLLVAVNSDASARTLDKAHGEPVISQDDRARIVAAVGCVDRVVLFDDPTPLTLIEEVGPDVLVKGGDYASSAVVGGDAVARRGGRVEIVPLSAGRSTTQMLERIRASS
ncbi:MAG: adenylyltransferase/cytidyltransferase family protein [Gemmatimonadales bacterium]